MPPLSTYNTSVFPDYRVRLRAEIPPLLPEPADQSDHLAFVVVRLMDTGEAPEPLDLLCRMDFVYELWPEHNEEFHLGGVVSAPRLDNGGDVFVSPCRRRR